MKKERSLSEIKSNLIRDIFYNIADQIHIKAKQSDTYISKQDASKIKHESTRGDLKETAVIEAIRSILPSGYSSSSGFVADSLGNVSPQIDIIIYEKNEIPIAFLQKDSAVIPIESFKVAIEVKSTLTTSNFDQIERQIKSLSEMKCMLHLPNNQNPLKSKKIEYKKGMQSVYIVCFDSKVAKETLNDLIKSNDFIIGIFVLNKYLLLSDGQLVNDGDDKVERTLMGLLHIWNHITGLVAYEKNIQREIAMELQKQFPELNIDDPFVKLRLSTPSLVAYIDKNF